MKVAFVSQFAPEDPRQWSGTVHHMMHALESAGIEVTPIGPLRPPPMLWPWYFSRHASHKLLGQSYARDREPAILKSIARQVEAKLAKSPVDVVISPSSVPLAYLKCHQPVVLWTDATFASMVGFYWHDLAGRSLRQGLEMEKQALQNVQLAVFASRWAADSAIAMGAPAARVNVVEFGANLKEPPTHERATMLIDQRISELTGANPLCRLLFIGVEWHRKGGRHAVAVAAELQKSGVNTELTIIGCQPPEADLAGARAAGVRLQLDGFLDKSSDTGRQRLDERLMAAHFFILPARAEAFGIVLTEANAYGLPCLVRRIGGMTTIVVDEVNGLTFTPECDAQQWAAAIRQLFLQPQRYRALALSSRNEYDTRLNWPTAGRRVRALIEAMPR